MQPKESRYSTNAIYNNKNQNIKLLQPKIGKSSHAIKNQKSNQNSPNPKKTKSRKVPK